MYPIFHSCSLHSMYSIFLALKAHQENFCNLPEEVSNFVGREGQLKECSEILDLESKKTFLIVTGGPCYGKSSLAVKLGYELYENVYSYVVWMNMRDMTRNPSNPSLEDIALNILQQFNIDTSELEKNIVEHLKRKLGMISNDSKSALLIFDNADNLIEPERDESCQSTEFEKLCQLIRNTKSIRCIFTSRVCNVCLDTKHHQVVLEYLSDTESRLFVTKELQNFSFQDRNALIQDFVVASHGLPYALKLMCSVVVRMGNEEMIMDYVNDLKDKPLDTLDDKSRLTKLFNLSYVRLDADEQAVFKPLAVFPSAFSYRYLSKVLKSVEGMNLKPRLLNTLKQHSLVSDNSGRYLIHPFLREFVKSKYWTEQSCKQYEVAYFKVYISQLFELARESLEKDSLANCLKEFRSEQQNFLRVVADIGKGWKNSPSHLRSVVKDLLKRPTTDYIKLVLFYCHELHSFFMIEFIKGCETFVEEQVKKNIWCCRFDVSMAIYEKSIDDDYKEVDADEYGKAMVEKRRLSQIMYKDRSEDTFNKAMADLEFYSKWAETLDDNQMKAYFKSKILKIRVRSSKRVYKSKTIGIDKNNLIRDLLDALDLCKLTFGLHGLTIDCYSQLGKLFWFLRDTDKAKASFDKAIGMAESLSDFRNKRHLSCLIDKGRLLVVSRQHDSILEGKHLLEATLREWKDVCGEFMWFIAMDHLVKVDRTRCDEVIDKFLEEKRLFHPSLDAMYSAFRVQLNFTDEEVNDKNFVQQDKSMVERLLRVIDHLENLCENSEHVDEKLLQAAIKYVFQWKTLIVTNAMHTLLQSDAQEIASKALELMSSHDFITSEKREELSFITKCDRESYPLVQRKCHILQMGKRIPAMKDELEKDLDNLLKDCERLQDVWLWIVRGLARENKSHLEKVTPYLLCQSEPSKFLLKLVSHKFLCEIEACKRESDTDAIEKSYRAVDDLKSASNHVEKLLADNMQGDISCVLKDALKKWYTQLALRTKQYMSKSDRVRYARKALVLLEKGDTIVSPQEKEFLKCLAP